ncbi:uncharacterized protein LOC110451328 [Mizuhopecten yessoensis]|uniref:uncharacterized protein LOC110451328 n=1 Tax=Mizuhopecten yessoensis TaxID=6573 RepID=UPI000B45C655|nr:uncharacterized protein LOC110451328 [Mizuhopecten yessoensis]
MAEGGPQPADQMNKDNTALTYQLLECPICLEQMRSPKSLPCLHSFCEECLSTYIVTDLSGEMAAVTSFPCPVCRKITSPVNHSEGKETWAQHFPTNRLLQFFNNHKEMADTPLNCGPCKKQNNQETPAKFLCRGIDTLFCEHCKINFHDIVHELCDVVTLHEANPDVTRGKQSSITCSKHNLMMDHHCENHKLIGCKKCIITDHQRCDDVTTIKEYCETKKNNLRLDEMEKSLNKAANCMGLMVNAFDQQVESLQRCQDVGLSSISDLRQRINTYLDKKQEEITQEMISKCKAEKAKVDLSKQKCSRLGGAIQITKEASHTALRMEDHLGMIQLFHRGQTEIGACNDLIDDIVYPLESVSINHNLDTNFFTINPSTTLPLGSILAMKQPFIIPDGIGYIQNVDSLLDSRAKKVGTCMIKIPSDQQVCEVHGILLMPTGNIVVSDCKNVKLKLISIKGQYLDGLNTNGHPHDVCLVDDDTMAVATTAGIHVVKVQPSKLTLSTVINVSTSIKCHGLAFMDGHFMVSTSKGIHRVALGGKVMQNHTLSSPCWHLASNTKKNTTFACLQTSSVVNTVVTRLPNGIQIYGIDERIVRNAMGVDVDPEGNVYVCGQDSNNVVQVSANGTKIRELLTSMNGINKPRAISVCGDKFVVTNQSSYENEIHVYQLY